MTMYESGLSELARRLIGDEVASIAVTPRRPLDGAVWEFDR